MSSRAQATRPRAEAAALFARRMAVIAALVALIVALTAPITYSWLSYGRLQEQAQATAGLYAQDLALVVARQPTLWRYQAAKRLQTVTDGLAIDHLGQVRVLDCARAQTLEALTLDSAGLPGPRAQAPILLGTQVAGWVEVTMDASAELRVALQIAAGAVLLGGVLGWLIYAPPTALVRRQGEELDEAQRSLEDANADLQRRVEAAVEEVRALSQRLVEVQEAERLRIAMDLHDGVGQLLTGLRFVLDRDQPDHARALALCADTLAEIRRIVRDLHPAELERQRLPEALRELCDRFEERAQIETSFRLVGNAPLSQERATCLLRVCQEALQNVARHAQAAEVGVVLTLRPEGATLEVFDDGRGFDPAAVTAGLGLVGMRQRLAVLGGTLELRSNPQDGARLVATLPMRV